MLKKVRESFEPSTLALLAIVLGTMIVGFVAYGVINNIRTEGRAANNARLDLQALLVIVIDQQTAVRGYAATHQKLFLDPYVRSQPSYGATLARLEVAARNPRMAGIARDLSAIRANYDVWRARTAEPIVRGATGTDASIRLRRGGLAMDRVRADLGRARVKVDAAANEVTGNVQNAIVMSILAIVAMTIILGVVAIRFEHARLGEEKRLREQVDERNAALRRSNQSLREFAYVASHDLQEPLRTIASFTQLLEKRYRGRLDPDADEFIGYVVDGAKRMQQLIDSILEYSRVSTHGNPMEPVDLDAVTRRSVANLRASIEERGAEVAIGPLPRVLGDDLQLGQLMQNLVGNALKYNRSPRPRVDVRARRASPVSWEITVADNGIGISPEYHERIFRIFSRLHARTEYGGTGIGLAVCKRIVDRHGGRMWVDSEEGRGAAFSFTLADAEDAA